MAISKSVFLAPALIFALSGCSEESISVYRVPKDEAAAQGGSRQPEQGHDHEGHDHEGHDHGPSRELAWSAPQGWSLRSGDGMRLASFALSDGAEVTVVKLSGEAGGEIANVNRWREQAGLAPAEPRQLERELQTIGSKAGPIRFIDIQGERRIAAARLFVSGESYFFKLTGDPKAVGAALPSFRSFLASVRLDG